MSLLFPTHCILCGQTISEQARGLCKACRAQIETEMQTLTCYPPEYVSDLVCAAQYRGSYRAALLHIKYAHEPYRLYPIAELMALAGGGSKLYGMAAYLSQSLGLEAHTSDEPETCVILGTRHTLNRLKQFSDVGNQSGSV